MNKLTAGAVGVLSLYGFYTMLSAFGVFESNPAPALVKPSEPDVQTIINTSVSSIRAQNELLVMTSTFNGRATSSMQSLGMSGELTDLVTAKVQYRLDLSKFDSSMVRIQGDEVRVDIPSTLLILNRLPYYDQRTYTNGSWMFSLGTDTTPLKRENMKKLRSNINQQAQALVPQARQNARNSLAHLISVPLTTAGVKKRVVVKFR